MARNDSELHDILDRVVDRLIDQLEEATAGNCYQSLDPDFLPQPKSADFYYVVSPAPGGYFDQEMFSGGGADQATAQTKVVVTIHNTRQLDQVGRDEVFLGSDPYGVMPRAKKVMKALCPHDLQDAAGDRLLVQPIFPADYNIQRVNRSIGSIQLGFNILYDWDLS